MMEKSDRPKWVRSFEESPLVSSPDFWNKPLKAGKQQPDTVASRLTSGNRWAMHDTSSLTPSTSTASSQHMRARRVALFIILIIGAFLLAVLVGLLVYYLFLSGRPNARDKVSGVTGSVRLLNLTYTSDMANASSEAFRQVAEPFCRELDLYVTASSYRHNYEGCQVSALRNVADVTDCRCLGVTKGTVMADFELRVNGTHSQKLIKEMYDIIENGVHKAKVDDVIYLHIKPFLVDIRLEWIMPYEAVEADITLAVYNLNHTSALTNHQSPDFRKLATPFCSDVDAILKNASSWLGDRYISCSVKSFDKRSSEHGTVSFTLLFGGLDPRPLQQGLVYVLLSGARPVLWYGQSLKMIGSLVVTPYSVDSDLRPVNRTQPAPNVTYLSVSLPVFNLTLTPEVSDPYSTLFTNISSQFCRDIAGYYQLSSLSKVYLNCTVLGFRPRKTRIDFRIGFLGDGWPGMDLSPRTVIKNYAPSKFYMLMNLYKVGSLYVILEQLTANGLELHTSLHVLNLTYASALADPSSQSFLHHAVLFCKDMDKFYTQSSLVARFHGCGVTSFTPSPVTIHFYLVFKGTQFNGITSSHIDVIRRFGSRVSWSGWGAYLVGDLLVLPEEQQHSVHPTNITVLPTPSLSSTSPPTTSSAANEAAKAVITADLYKFHHSADVLNPNSQTFRKLEHNFCSDVDRVYLSSILFLTYRGCQIQAFSPSPHQAVFNLYFDTRPSGELKNVITYVLESDSPKANLSHSENQVMEVLHLGDLYLKWRLINLEPHGEIFPTPLPTLSPTSTVKATLTSSPTATSSLLPTMTSGFPETTPLPPTRPPEKANVPFTYTLYNFTYVPDLLDPNSDLFETYERRLCLDVQEIFKASPIFYLLYAGCEIEKFGSDPAYVTFRLSFYTKHSDMLRQTAVNTLQESRDHVSISTGDTHVFQLLPLGGLMLVLNVQEVTSSYVMSTVAPPQTTSSWELTSATSSVVADGVAVSLYYETYGMNYTVELADPESARFRQHRERVCADLDRWFGGHDSQFYLTYHGCRVNFFRSRPDGVAFSVGLRMPVLPNLARTVQGWVETKAPRRLLSGYVLLEVGDLLLILDRSRVTVTSTILPSHSPTPVTPTSAWSSQTLLVMTSSPEPSPTSSLWPSPSVQPTLLAYLVFRFSLADFEFTPDLKVNFSARYRVLEDYFCREVASLYSDTVYGPWYKGCSINEFIESPGMSYPPKVTFTFEWDVPTGQEMELPGYVTTVLLERPPRVELDGYKTVKVGSLHLIIDTLEVVVPGHIDSTSSRPDISLRSALTSSVFLTPTPTATPTTSTSPPTTTSTTPNTTTTTTPTTTTTTSKPTTTTTTPTTTTTSTTTTTPATTTTTKSTTTTTPSTTTTTKPTTTTTKPTTTTTTPTTTTTSTTTTTTSTTTTTPATTTTTKSTTTTTPSTTTTTKPTTTTTKPTTTTTTPTTTTSTTTTTKPTTTTTTPTTTTTKPTTTTTKPTTTTTTPTTTTTKPTTTTTKTTTTTTPKTTTTTTPTTTTTTPTTTTTTPTTTTSTPTTTKTTRTSTTTTTPTTTEPSYFLRMSFEVINMTWHQELNDSTSDEFRQHEETFCRRLIQILPINKDKDFMHFMNCKIDAFGGHPLRMNFSLQFKTLEGHDPDRMQRLVISNVKEHALRTTFQDLVVLQVGDLFLSMASITVHIKDHTDITPPNTYDSIAYEYLYGLYPGNFSAALLDETSPEFRTAAWEFCSGAAGCLILSAIVAGVFALKFQITNIFRNVGIRDIRERYLSCYVNNFGDGARTTVNFTIVFNDTNYIDSERLHFIIFYSQLREGMEYLPIGSLWVTANQTSRYYLLMLRQMTTHAYPYTTTTAPTVFTYVEIKFQVQAPEWTSDLAERTSLRFQTLAQSFCTDVSKWIERVLPDYLGCEVLQFESSPVVIVADLKFRGEQPASLDTDVDTILLESPDWVTVSNAPAIKIGDLFIHADSLVYGLRTVPAASTTPSDAGPTTALTRPTPTLPSNPCVLGGDTYRHPVLCDRFLQCDGDQMFEIECGAGSIYTDNTCKTPNAGFLCTAAASYE